MGGRKESRWGRRLFHQADEEWWMSRGAISLGELPQRSWHGFYTPAEKWDHVPPDLPFHLSLIAGGVANAQPRTDVLHPGDQTSVWSAAEITLRVSEP